MLKVCCISILFVSSFCFAQYEVKINAHNDANNIVPFWCAYANRVASIEIDVFLKEGKICILHDRKNRKLNDWTIEKIYLKPLKKARETLYRYKLLLLIDIKSEPYSIMKKLVRVLSKYDYIKDLDSEISVVITGKRPRVEDYNTYPSFIKFDVEYFNDLEKTDEDRIVLVSLPFDRYSYWNGKDEINKEEFKILKNLVNQCHQYNKPIRFWDTPDTPLAWQMLKKIGVDYINTDNLQELMCHFNK